MRKSLSAKNRKRIDEDKLEDEIIEEVLDDNESDDAETAPNFVEGDIAIPEVKKFQQNFRKFKFVISGKIPSCNRFRPISGEEMEKQYRALSHKQKPQ